ncbi:beta-galactosidase/arabinogalactan endo-1,4-beta-galactosidase [Mucilaginibacter mallensis]|uniref:Arabinogalactan endo-beta-1,4-galactanase n=1 Tax=Mucilaginibacter mallensis TaxID=652787 RepID=A0A1H1SMB2_MUCMA|nr:glycosyl hydrolase 53 family protein [Mucilaginibacter mallensis]SDS49061.1 beta-galactosidase/arabinogalactan endo-1,4-beta-galactosidase [Mucilaginibacter mallensis]
MKKKIIQSLKISAGLLVVVFTVHTLFAFKSSPPKKHIHFDKILGADISFLPQLEAEGHKFYDNGTQKDAIQILKDHGFNYVRLRIFNNPAADSGYSKKGFCDLESTKKMALRIKAAGMGFLLDFHYSDNWADPGKQHKPSAWRSANYQQLQDSLRAFTKNTLLALKQQGTLPDMVQIGNEISHGMLWPDASLKHLDTLAAFLKAGVQGVKDVDKSIKIMLHIACGGENGESRYFLDNMLKRDVKFDIIGESYYPEWHGPTDSLSRNLIDLNQRYKQDVIVVEYSQQKQAVNDIEFSLPGNKMKGTFIWEPLNYGEAAFDHSGNANDYMKTYSEISKKYNITQ